MMRWDTLILTCVFTSVSVQELAKTQQYKVIKGKALSYATKTCGLSQVRLSDMANTTILDNDSVVYG